MLLLTMLSYQKLSNGYDINNIVLSLLKYLIKKSGTRLALTFGKTGVIVPLNRAVKGRKPYTRPADCGSAGHPTGRSMPGCSQNNDWARIERERSVIMNSMEDVNAKPDTGRQTVKVFEKIGGCHEH
jgi:hypothetical protein